MIWLIGGTAETGKILERIRGKVEYIVTVATPEGKEMLDDEHVLVSRMDYQAMLTFIETCSIDLVVDISHPYASEVTQNARWACQETNIHYFRFVRKPSKIKECTKVSSLDECLEYLKTISGCVFFTTGSKNIQDFEQVKGKNRFVYRILPICSSIETCRANNVHMKDIVAILGPVSEDLNVAMFQAYQADYVVMKDSGKAGGTPEKLKACQRLGIIPIIIGRADEDGISDLETLVSLICPQSTSASHPHDLRDK